ncbi:MAG: glycosyltransferase family 2 protein [Flavobacteriales bacterium]
MPFSFLKYLQPTHYFQLPTEQGHYVFPKIEDLPKEVLQILVEDDHYSCETAKRYDLSWQAIQKGYIGKANTYTTFEKLPLVDEYRFIRKYFHWVWVFYVLVLRLVLLHNPIKEIKCWFKTRCIKRQDLYGTWCLYADLNTFESPLVLERPLVSVIIPTLNRYIYLKDVLHDLEQQDYANFEVLVVDQSEPFQKEFYEPFKLNLKVEHQKEKALWLARNNAIKQALGNYILLFDDDSRVAPDWIREHLKCLDFFKAEVSSGVSISVVGAEVPKHYKYFKVSDQLDTGNVLIKKEVFKKLGLFDRQFEGQRMGDGEFGLRIYTNGYTNISNPFAKRLHLKVGTGGLRDMGSWDAFRPNKWFAPRPIPSVLYFFRNYFGNRAARLALLRTIPLSVLPYRFKKNKPLLVLGGFLTVLLLPLVCFQVYRSWRLSNKKLRQGAIIESL